MAVWAIFAPSAQPFHSSWWLRSVRDGWLGQLAVQRADGEGALASKLSTVLQDAGFRATPKGLRLRA